MDTDDCHARILPENETKAVRLIRLENEIYKFTFRSRTAIGKLVKEYGEIVIQQKIEALILFALKMQAKEPLNMDVSTYLFKAKVKIYPWVLSTKVCFKSTSNEEVFYASELQYSIRILEKDTMSLQDDILTDATNQNSEGKESNSNTILHKPLNKNFQELQKLRDSNDSEDDIKRVTQEDLTDNIRTGLNGNDSKTKTEKDDIKDSAKTEEILKSLINTKRVHPLIPSPKKQEGFFTRVFLQVQCKKIFKF